MQWVTVTQYGETNRGATVSVFNNLYPNAVVPASASAALRRVPRFNWKTDATDSISVYDQSSIIFPLLSQFIVCE